MFFIEKYNRILNVTVNCQAPVKHFWPFMIVGMYKGNFAISCLISMKKELSKMTFKVRCNYVKNMFLRNIKQIRPLGPNPIFPNK